MFGRPAAPSCGRRCEIIQYRVVPCVTDHVQVRVFLRDTDEVLFRIPAVAEDDDVPLAVECRHHLPDHGSGKVKLRGALFPHVVSKGYSNVRDLLPLPDGYTEHEADKAVAVEVIGAVVCGMVE